MRDTSICCLSHAPTLGTWPVTQVCALLRNWTSDLLVCRPALNPLSHTSQGKISFFGDKIWVLFIFLFLRDLSIVLWIFSCLINVCFHWINSHNQDGYRFGTFALVWSFCYVLLCLNWDHLYSWKFFFLFPRIF